MNFKNPKRNQEHISNGGSVSIQQSRTLTEYSRYEHKFGNIYLSHTHTHTHARTDQLKQRGYNRARCVLEAGPVRLAKGTTLSLFVPCICIR